MKLLRVEACETQILNHGYFNEVYNFRMYNILMQSSKIFTTVQCGNAQHYSYHLVETQTYIQNHDSCLFGSNSNMCFPEILVRLISYII